MYEGSFQREVDIGINEEYRTRKTYFTILWIKKM